MEIDQFINIIKYAGRLKNLPRNGWIFRGVPNPESISDHSYRVNLITLFLSEVISGLDIVKALRISIVHDLGESILTDIPKETMEILTESAKLESEHNAFELLFKGGDSAYIELIDEYNKRETLEARVVYAADKLEMLFQGLEYYRNGYSEVEEFFNDLSYIKNLKIEYVTQLVEKIEEEFNKLKTKE